MLNLDLNGELGGWLGNSQQVPEVIMRKGDDQFKRPHWPNTLKLPSSRAYSGGYAAIQQTLRSSTMQWEGLWAKLRPNALT